MKYSGSKLALALSLACSIIFLGCAGNRYSQSTGEVIDNAAITAKVKAALIDDPQVSGLAVKVDTYKGVVQLSGFVDTTQQKKRAEDLAWGIDGVRSVENNITVKQNLPPK
ncbi:MAG: BON domain-containing protein [Verrucomicrobiota bacterium]|jgi:hyperosmotically inducible periplasmic protein